MLVRVGIQNNALVICGQKNMDHVHMAFISFGFVTLFNAHCLDRFSADFYVFEFYVVRKRP